MDFQSKSLDFESGAIADDDDRWIRLRRECHRLDTQDGRLEGIASWPKRGMVRDGDILFCAPFVCD
jgi:hypothetical protein